MFNVTLIKNNQQVSTNMTLDEILAHIYREVDIAEVTATEYESTLFVKGVITLTRELLSHQLPDHIKVILDNGGIQLSMFHVMDDYDQLVVSFKFGDITFQNLVDYAE